VDTEKKDGGALRDHRSHDPKVDRGPEAQLPRRNGRERPQLRQYRTARRLGPRMRVPHAVAFNVTVLGVSDDHDRLTAVAGYILAHRLDTITNRDVQRGDRTMRNLVKKDIEKIFDQLDALGWINRIPAGRPADPPRCGVNPECHRLFQARAEKEASRRLSTREAIAQVTRRV
jgi:hypothetical protein